MQFSLYKLENTKVTKSVWGWHNIPPPSHSWKIKSRCTAGRLFFLPSCEPRQCQPDFLWYFVEVCCFIQLKIHQKFKFAEIPRTFHLQNDKNKSNLLILLKYFVKFPVRQSISCEQSSQVHGEKEGLLCCAGDGWYILSTLER